MLFGINIPANQLSDPVSALALSVAIGKYLSNPAYSDTTLFTNPKT